ncbi:MAG: hypothetical protein ABI333_11390 [bacterium]
MRRNVLANLGILLGVLLILAAGCEVSQDGDLAVTWRFNGHAEEQGNDPCAAIDADRIVIELAGPEQVADVVACDSFDPKYPLSFLAAGTTTWAFSRLTKDLDVGTYQLRVFFLDPDDRELDDPPAHVGTVKIESAKTTRLDLDFPVSTGRIRASWQIAGGTGACTEIGAATIALTLAEVGGAAVDDVELPCDGDNYSMPGLTPGSYEITGQLQDVQGTPITNVLTRTDLTVETADLTTTSLNFAWSDFTIPIEGNARFELLVANTITSCSEVPDLANGPLFTRMLLTAAGGTPIPTAEAQPNPDGQTDCTGLAAGQTLDGTTVAGCQDVEQIICGLQVGDYTLSVEALDASDLVCYGADLELHVGLTVGDPERLVLRATQDATACWE